MRGTTGLWIGLVVVAINGLVFGLDLHGFLIGRRSCWSEHAFIC